MERLDHNPQRIDSVRTSLLYLSDSGELDRDDATGWPERSTPHEVTISNGRVERKLSLDRTGFRPIRRESAVKNFYDEREVCAIYYPELARLLTEITGAAKSWSLRMTCAPPTSKSRTKKGPRTDFLGAQRLHPNRRRRW